MDKHTNPATLAAHWLTTLVLLLALVGGPAAMTPNRHTATRRTATTTEGI